MVEQISLILLQKWSSCTNLHNHNLNLNFLKFFVGEKKIFNSHFTFQFFVHHFEALSFIYVLIGSFFLKVAVTFYGWLFDSHFVLF